MLLYVSISLTDSLTVGRWSFGRRGTSSIASWPSSLSTISAASVVVGMAQLAALVLSSTASSLLLERGIYDGEG